MNKLSIFFVLCICAVVYARTPQVYQFRLNNEIDVSDDPKDVQEEDDSYKNAIRRDDDDLIEDEEGNADEHEDVETSTSKFINYEKAPSSYFEYFMDFMHHMYTKFIDMF